jgi:hypothetical protein
METSRPNVIDYAREAVARARGEATATALAPEARATMSRDPFPHLVVENILPRELYESLDQAFPSDDYVIDGAPFEDNRTYLRTSDQSLADPDLPPLWRNFIETNTTQSVLDSAIAIWADEIARCHPGLEANFGKPLEAFEAARRHGTGDSPANRGADVMIDCQFGVNSPVRRVGTPRGPHVDAGSKLFSALLYFRNEKDEQEGGQYELYRLRRGPFPKNRMKKVPDRYVERVKQIPVRGNSLVMWINTPDAVHAVGRRGVTPKSRRYIAISGECFGGARPSDFFSHFDAWDSPLGRLRASIGLF